VSTAWSWLALAGLGALHGLNPAMGWIVVATRGARAGGPARAPAWRALLPIAAGHLASVALVAALAVTGLWAQRGWLPWLAAGLAALAAALHASTHGSRPARRAARVAGLALWSLAMGVVSGTGLMLVPTLASLCAASAPAREITALGSLALALAAVGVHLLAMLAAMASAAWLAERGWRAVGPRWARPRC